MRGEITLVIDLGRPIDDEAAAAAGRGRGRRRAAGRGLSRRDAAAALHVCLGMPRREAERLTREVAARGG